MAEKNTPALSHELYQALRGIWALPDLCTGYTIYGDVHGVVHMDVSHFLSTTQCEQLQQVLSKYRLERIIDEPESKGEQDASNT